jgi:hypothetical protein
VEYDATGHDCQALTLGKFEASWTTHYNQRQGAGPFSLVQWCKIKSVFIVFFFKHLLSPKALHMVSINQTPASMQADSA